MANCVSVMKKCCVCISSPSLAVAGEHGKRHAMQAHKPQAVSDWLNPLSFVHQLNFKYESSVIYQLYEI